MQYGPPLLRNPDRMLRPAAPPRLGVRGRAGRQGTPHADLGRVQADPRGVGEALPGGRRAAKAHRARGVRLAGNVYKTERFDRELGGRLRGAPFVSTGGRRHGRARPPVLQLFLRAFGPRRQDAGRGGRHRMQADHAARNAHAWKLAGWPAGAGGLNPCRFARAGRSGGFPARAARGFLDHDGILGTVLRPIRPVRSRAASLAYEYCTLPKTAKDAHRIMPGRPPLI